MAVPLKTTVRNTRSMNTTAPTPPGIEIAGVTRRFGSVTAVNDVSLTITLGEVRALWGANGAGKATLLDMVLGFTEPNAGTLTTFGHAPKRAATNGQVGAVLQDGGLLDDLTVLETIKMVAACHHWHAPIDDVLQRAGVGSFTTRKVKKWSGEQKQRRRYVLAALRDPRPSILEGLPDGLDLSAPRQYWDAMHAQGKGGSPPVRAADYFPKDDEYAQRVVPANEGQ